MRYGKPIKKKKHIAPRYFLHETEDPFGDMDKALGTEATPGKHDCNAQPANGEEARAMAAAALKAAEASSDPAGEMDVLLAYCVRDTRKGKSGGETATQVTFKNGARVVLKDSEWK